MIDISDMSKAEVLHKLFNASKTQGMGIFTSKPDNMTLEECQTYVNFQDKRDSYFDYFNGRVMKVDIGHDSLDPRLYDRDNGEGAAQRALYPETED